MREIIRGILYIVGLMLFIQCKPGVPMDILSPDELEEVLYDYHVAQSIAENKGDSVSVYRYRYVKSVFEKHNITEAEFDSTMIWYSKHASYLQGIYKNLRERYNDNVSALASAKGSGDILVNLNEQGDTANIWQEHPFSVLKANPNEDKILFSLLADSTFRKGDSFIWRFSSRFISEKRNRNELYAGYYVKYSNDSVVGVSQRLYSDGLIELKLETDTSMCIKNIGGFVYFKGRKNDESSKLLLIDNIKLIRMHSKIVTEMSLHAETNDLTVDTTKKDDDTLSVVDTIKTKKVRRFSPNKTRKSQSNTILN